MFGRCCWLLLCEANAKTGWRRCGWRRDSDCCVYRVSKNIVVTRTVTTNHVPGSPDIYFENVMRRHQYMSNVTQRRWNGHIGEPSKLDREAAQLDGVWVNATIHRQSNNRTNVRQSRRAVIVVVANMCNVCMLYSRMEYGIFQLTMAGKCFSEKRINYRGLSHSLPMALSLGESFSHSLSLFPSPTLSPTSLSGFSVSAARYVMHSFKCTDLYVRISQESRPPKNIHFRRQPDGYDCGCDGIIDNCIIQEFHSYSIWNRVDDLAQGGEFDCRKQQQRTGEIPTTTL